MSLPNKSFELLERNLGQLSTLAICLLQNDPVAGLWPRANTYERSAYACTRCLHCSAESPTLGMLGERRETRCEDCGGTRKPGGKSWITAPVYCYLVAGHFVISRPAEDAHAISLSIYPSISAPNVLRMLYLSVQCSISFPMFNFGRTMVATKRTRQTELHVFTRSRFFVGRC